MKRNAHGDDQDLDRELSAWLEDVSVSASPRNLTTVIERTRGMRQRPAWASLERWLLMTVITARPELVAPLRAAWLLLITLLVLALVTGGLLIGAHLMQSTAVIPQGRQALIAFGTLDDGPDGQKAGDIYTVRADGTDLRRLTDGPEWEADPAWSPDGTRIAFRSWVDGTDSVVVMDADGESRTTLASSQQSRQDCLKSAGLAWAPDGSSIIFPTRDPDCAGPHDLQIVAADGSSPATPLLTESFDGRLAAWSPDGTAIAFVGNQDQPSVGLYIADTNPARALEGPTRARRIGPDLGDLANMSSAPRWSPDGSTVAVSSAFGLSATDDVYLVPADFSGEVLTIENAWNPAWSPDGTQLAFQRRVDPSEYFDDRPCTVRTWLVDADGSNERQLDELGDGCDFGPAWSPDGTRLFHLWIDTDPANPDEVPFHLSIVPVDGSGPPIHLLDTGGASWQPVVPSP